MTARSALRLVPSTCPALAECSVAWSDVALRRVPVSGARTDGVRVRGRVGPRTQAPPATPPRSPSSAAASSCVSSARTSRAGSPAWFPGRTRERRRPRRARAAAGDGAAAAGAADAPHAPRPLRRAARTCAIRRRTTTSRSSRSWRGSGSARTGCRRPPTVPRRRSARSASTGTSRSRSRPRRRSPCSSSRSRTRRSSAASRSAAAATSSRPSSSARARASSPAPRSSSTTCSPSPSRSRAAATRSSACSRRRCSRTSSSSRARRSSLLVLLNLRGVRESVTVLTPIFGVFLVTHAFLIVGGVGGARRRRAARRGRGARTASRRASPTLGAVGLFGVFVRAYSMGAGTYTGHRGGLERAPDHARAEGGDRAPDDDVHGALARDHAPPGSSLLLPAVPRLAGAREDDERGAARALRGRVPAGRRPGRPGLRRRHAGRPRPRCSFVAAQAGFIDGPRVMANMAHDSWLPHRFGQLSDRLTMQDGVLLMGARRDRDAPLHGRRHHPPRHDVLDQRLRDVLAVAGGDAALLVGARRGARDAVADSRSTAWRSCSASRSSSAPCTRSSAHGGWVTLAVTVGGRRALRRDPAPLPPRRHRACGAWTPCSARCPRTAPRLRRSPSTAKAHTAVLLVGGYGGLGVHSLLTDPAALPGALPELRLRLGRRHRLGDDEGGRGGGARPRAGREDALRRYVDLARRLGLAAELPRRASGPRPSRRRSASAREVAREFPRAIFFAGKLVFERERWFQRLLHNETAYQLQRRLQFAGLNAMVLPVRVLAARG